MLCYTFLSLLKRLSTEVGLTCVAQKRLCLSSLICVQRKTWGRKQANASKTWKNDDGRKRQMCREISTRSGRRFTSFLFPSRGPLHFVTTTRLCPRAQYKKRSIWGGGGPLPISFPPPPHLFRRQIRRLKVLNMTWNHILIIRYPLSKLNAGLKIDFRETPQVTVRGFEMLFSTIHFCYFSDALRFNPFTAKVLHGLL